MSSEVRDFLLMHFEEDRSQRPEFELGFAALRLGEMKKLAGKYGLDLSDAVLDPNRRKASAAEMMNAWWNQGRFPKPTKKTLAQEVMEQMTPEMLRDALAAKTGGLTGTQQINPELHAEPAHGEMKPYSEWDLPALRSYASAQGVDIYRKKRGQIEDALNALKVV